MVQLKKKVTIKRKSSQEEIPVAGPIIEEPQNTEPASPIETQKQSNTGKVLGGIAVTAAILAGVYFWGIKSDDNQSAQDENHTEQVESNQNGVTPNDNEEKTVAGTESNDGEKESSSEDTQVSTGNDEVNAGQSTAQTQAENTEESPSAPKQELKATEPKEKSAHVSNASAPLSDDVNVNARRVIRGEFGCGQERKDKLGASYKEIQGKVNEMYRKGLVH